MDQLTVQKDTRIWLFYGYDIKIEQIIKRQLDTYFSLITEQQVVGQENKQILVYQNR